MKVSACVCLAFCNVLHMKNFNHTSPSSWMYLIVQHNSDAWEHKVKVISNQGPEFSHNYTIITYKSWIFHVKKFHVINFRVKIFGIGACTSTCCCGQDLDPSNFSCSIPWLDWKPGLDPWLSSIKIYTHWAPGETWTISKLPPNLCLTSFII